MSTTTDLSTLKINYLTQAQYDDALDDGDINENELYLTPAITPVTDVTVNGTSVVSSGTAALTVSTNWLNGSATGSVRTSDTVAEGTSVGGSTYTMGGYATAEGCDTVASGTASHAEGYGYHDYIVASGNGSHAEGIDTTASGWSSHAEGDETTASGSSSHSQNTCTIANQHSQTALGTYNIADTTPSTAVHPNGSTAYGKYAVIIGNGTTAGARNNALAVDWTGEVELDIDTSSTLYTDIVALGWTSDVIAT